MFASELKSLLASGLVPTELDYEAIDAYLTLGFFPAPATPLAASRSSSRAACSSSRAARSSSGATGAIRSRRSSAAADVEEWSERLLAKLEESVRLRLMSDVPLGAMLSGGLDSSLIVALMAQHDGRPVQTFAVGFSEAGEGNELADARYVADDARRRPSRARALVRARRRSRSTDLIWHLDEPLADLSSLGFIALSELAAHHVTVALSGQGADELLGGYRKHRAA